MGVVALMASLYLTLGLVTALLSAARSTWSPCGLSMLSSITPFGERARGTRFAWTAEWFIAGGLLGGASLGGLVALAARTVTGLSGATTPLNGEPAMALGAFIAMMAIAGSAADLGLMGPILPLIRRQVDDGWMRRLRPWVYGFGFGWQIGFGFTTYLMTAGVALTVALAVAAGVSSASVLPTLAVCSSFGLARGLTVLLGGKASTPSRLRSIHSYLERFEKPARLAASVSQAGVCVAVVAAVVFASADGVGPSPAWSAGLPLAVLALGLAPFAAASARRRAGPLPPRVHPAGASVKITTDAGAR